LVVAVVRPRVALSVVHLRAVEAGGLIAPLAIPIVVPLIRVDDGRSSHVGRRVVGRGGSAQIPDGRCDNLMLFEWCRLNPRWDPR
jgi:hypothetical protein